jgi:inosose dehydratase
MASEEYGLSCSIHSHAGGYVDFEDEVEVVLAEIDPKHLAICLDTGHLTFAGIDPLAFYKRHSERVSYVHLKDIDPGVMAQTIADRTDYYDACANGLFCRLGEGIVDFDAFRSALKDSGYAGWATVEQDCDPAGKTSPLDDATKNFTYLRSVGLA